MAVLVGDDLRERVTDILAGTDLAPVFGGPRSPAGLRLVDLHNLLASGRIRQQDHVAVVCRQPTDSERVRCQALGARAVLDIDSSAEEVAGAIDSLERHAATAGADHSEPVLGDFTCRSPAMRGLLDESRRLAERDSSILLTGDTGVGKEYLARAIHAAGPRAGKPFVVVNCGALPETLLESQLFGHERGAFTGADQRHRGFFEIAQGGTLLLDEIGEMPTHLQVKLLTVLERREVVRLGGSSPIAVDVRVMAATNRDVVAEMKSGAFREDLYYRLNVIRLRVPSLTERVEDIPDLTGRLLYDLLEDDVPNDFDGVTDSALRALTSYSWPGNVRELRNVLERALVLGGSTRIDLADLRDEVRSPRARSTDTPWLTAAPGPDWDGLSLRELREAAVAGVERAYLRRLLEQTKGRIAKTAERAGLRPRSLYDKMQRYGLRKEDFRDKRQAGDRRVRRRSGRGAPADAHAADSVASARRKWRTAEPVC